MVVDIMWLRYNPYDYNLVVGTDQGVMLACYDDLYFTKRGF